MPAHDDDILIVHPPKGRLQPVVLDSPHSGSRFPADFGASVSEADLRDGEDSFIDELYLPATERGIPLLAAQFPRTYLDANRHADDIDLALLEGGHWPHAAPAQRQGPHRQGADLAHARRRPADLPARVWAWPRCRAASNAATGPTTRRCANCSMPHTPRSASSCTSTAIR